MKAGTLVGLGLVAVACGRTDLDGADYVEGERFDSAATGQAGRAGQAPGAGGRAGGGGLPAGRGGQVTAMGGQMTGTTGGQMTGMTGGQASSAGRAGSGGVGGSVPDPSAVPASCLEIQESGRSTGDGTYAIRLAGGATVQVSCLMSADGGGWTLVGNFPWPGNTAGVPQWTSGAQIGSSFDDLTKPFKLADGDINALRTYGFRAFGSATRCIGGACNVSTLLFWRATCSYSSSSNSPACSDAYRDVAFMTPAAGASPCAWHWGLVAATCNLSATLGTSHSGDHVFAGEYGSWDHHAYDGRAGENPSVRFWVR